MNRWRLHLTGLLALVTTGARPACAHTPSETFLTLAVSGTHLAGQWDVALVAAMWMAERLFAFKVLAF